MVARARLWTDDGDVDYNRVQAVRDEPGATVTIDYAARLDALLEKSEADLVAFVPGENMVYFTGLHFHLSERPILGLYSRQGLSFIIPELEVAKLEARPDLEARRFMWTDQSGYDDAFREAVAALAPAGTACAMDGQTLRFFEWRALESAGLPCGEGAGCRRPVPQHARAQSAGRDRQYAAGDRYQRSGAGGDDGLGAAGHDRAPNRRPAVGGNGRAGRAGVCLLAGPDRGKERTCRMVTPATAFGAKTSFC